MIENFKQFKMNYFVVMVKAGLGADEVKKLRFWQLAVSELVGTLFVVLFTSLVVSRHDGKSVIMTIR